ncbi:MAG: GTP-binding protein [Promethearchaeota archaeon]
MNPNFITEKIVNSDDHDHLFNDTKIIDSINGKLKGPEIKDKINILVIGPPKVGKTSLIYRYLFNHFKDSYIISTDVKNFNYNIKNLVGKNTDVVLWDIPGQISTDLLRSRFKGLFRGIICMFDVSNKNSFNQVKSTWIPFLKSEFKNVYQIFIGKKIDLTNRRQVYKRDKFYFYSRVYLVGIIDRIFIIPFFSSSANFGLICLSKGEFKFFLAEKILNNFLSK